MNERVTATVSPQFIDFTLKHMDSAKKYRTMSVSLLKVLQAMVRYASLDPDFKNTQTCKDARAAIEKAELCLN
jgi:hypothetical protein